MLLAGEVFVNPDAETIKKYEEKAKAYAEEKAALQILKTCEVNYNRWT